MLLLSAIVLAHPAFPSSLAVKMVHHPVLYITYLANFFVATAPAPDKTVPEPFGTFPSHHRLPTADIDIMQILSTLSSIVLPMPEASTLSLRFGF